MIEILQGDLTEIAADAIVNAANTDLLLGAGVAGAIRKKGGPSIQVECDRHGPVPLGGAALTGAGSLKARWVIHAAGMGLGQGVTEDSLRATTRNSLRLAEERRMGHIAFPAIGTGIGGFPIDACARIMLSLAQEHLRDPGHALTRISFVLFDAASVEVFRREAQRLGLPGTGAGITGR